MTPFFSVVIPTFNRSDLLQETLDSVDRQEFRDFEVIVVDDGSTEDISSPADRHQTRVTILRQANAGPSAARNRGVGSAGGEYIAFLDSDDVWFPWTLAVYHHIIREHDCPAFVAGCPRLFREPRELAAESNTPLQIREFADYYGGSDAWRWFGVSSFVIRRDVFTQCGGFSTEMRYGEDADLAMKLGTAAGFVQVLRPATFGYRQGAVDQLTGDWKQELPSVQTLVANESHLHYPGANQRAVERRRIICRHSRPVVISLVRQRQFAPAWKLYLQLLAWHLRLGQWKFVFGFPAWGLWQQTFGSLVRAGSR